MICFFCKAEIDSDHICQEIVEYMEEPATVEEVARIRAQIKATEASHRRAE